MICYQYFRPLYFEPKKFHNFKEIFDAIIDPAYAKDGKHDTPRGFPGTSPIVPPANAVSRALFSIERGNTENAKKHLTTLFMTFGQFLDHDITLTPHAPCGKR